ncbi:hypothetical protein CRUP_008724 [Coryphaenoides rupestris]|nr:hypothetical protein CRUP_008724 [Coryphaenoides rupestris]
MLTAAPGPEAWPWGGPAGVWITPFRVLAAPRLPIRLPVAGVVAMPLSYCAMRAAIAEFGLSRLPNIWEGARLNTEPGKLLTWGQRRIQTQNKRRGGDTGVVAMNGEGGAREGAAVCCWDNSELVPPMAPSPVTDDDPSALQNTPEGRDEQLVIPQDRRVEPAWPGSVPFLRSDGDFWIPVPTAPIILSAPPPPPAPPPTVIPPRPGRPDEDGDAMAEEEEEEEMAPVATETGSVSEGAGSDGGSGGLVSVVKHGPKRFRQLPFFFFFTPSSPPRAPAPTRPGPAPEVEGWARLKPTPTPRFTVSGGVRLCEFSYSFPRDASGRGEGEGKQLRARTVWCEPSEAPASEAVFTRQLLNEGGGREVVPPPGRRDESEKPRKSEDDGAEEDVLLAPVAAVAEVAEVTMVTGAEGSGFPEDARDLRPPLCPTTWPPPATAPAPPMLPFLFLVSGPGFPPSAEPSLTPPPPGAAWADGTSWKLAVVKRAVPSSRRFCEPAGGREATPPPEPLLQLSIYQELPLNNNVDDDHTGPGTFSVSRTERCGVHEEQNKKKRLQGELIEIDIDFQS